MMADKDTVVRLLKTARGQLDGILKMVDDDRYCMDIYNQILAAQSILKKTNKEILKSHMNHCVNDAFLDGNEEHKKEKIEEIISVIDKF